MPHASASYKLAIRYENWTRAGGHFYHPFQRLESVGGMSAAEWWLKLQPGGEPFDYACFTVPMLCDASRSPKYLNGTVYDEKVTEFYPASLARPPLLGPLESDAPNVFISGHEVQYPYAYHFNAAELATFLQGFAVERGVVRVVDDVVDVPLREDGSIAAVRTRQHGLIEGDLFIDCTGFRGLLINGALGEPFLSFGHNLLNDRAVAIQVPRDLAKDGIRPYTTARAHSAGWSWNIPLWGRDGTGYVYSSSFLSPNEAERELREFLGPAAEHSDAAHIKMRVGRCRNSWVKNCVAIGLSSGFVEPLESTGIFFIQHGIEELVSHFPSATAPDEHMVRSYNRTIAECIDGVREFLILHFFTNDRVDTPFWRATKSVELPDSLRERLDIWKARLPGPRNTYQPFHGFEPYSWAVILLGMGYQPTSYLPVLDGLDESKALAMFRVLQARAVRLTETLPSQYDYLKHLRKPR